MKRLNYQIATYLIPLSCALLILYSCAEEKVDVQKQVIKDVYLEQGVLHFSNSEVFLETLNNIKSYDSVKLASWKNQFTGFYSLRDKYDSILEIRYNSEEEDDGLTLEEIVAQEGLPFIPEFSFSSVINENGVYTIGNKIHRISVDRYEHIYDFDLELLRSKEAMLSMSEDEYTKFKIQDLLVNKTNSNSGRTTWWYGTAFEGVLAYWDLGEPHLAVDFRAWCTNYSTHNSSGASMTGRKFKKPCWLCQWKWRNDNMWYAEVDARIRVLTNNGNHESIWFPVGGNDTHVSYMSGEVISPVGPYIWNAPAQGAEIEVTFTYEDDGYPRRSYYREYN